MCLDAEGNIVTVGGWKKSGAGPLVQVLSPTGAVIESHPLPGDIPNRCCFGGADLDTLFVTTGGGELYRAKTTRRGRKRGA
jgi:gluconolactonase